jgi:hypothetical protein
MDEKLKQIYDREIQKLPKENQMALMNFDWVKISAEIGQKYFLNEEEVSDLQLETMLVLLGLEDPEFYVDNIENEVGTSKNVAEKVANEVLEKILTPINNVILENIKKSEEAKNPNWKQSLNFVLSGGNYGVFLEKGDAEAPVPTATPKINTLSVPKKMNDLRDKFVI